MYSCGRKFGLGLLWHSRHQAIDNLWLGKPFPSYRFDRGSYTADATIDVSGMVEVDIVGQAMNLHHELTHPSPSSHAPPATWDWLDGRPITPAAPSAPIGLWQLMQVAVGGTVAAAALSTLT